MTPMYQVYGIKNCNTVKKAITWLEQHHIAYQFHDYKKEGISGATLKKWDAQVGWEAVLNKKGLTWRRLTADDRAKIVDSTSAVAILEKQPSLIRRPLIAHNDKVLAVGFDEQQYSELFL